MFPIIPALILFLLHGPSSFERLMVPGMWPSGSEAVVRANKTDAEVLREVVAAVCAALQPEPRVSAKPSTSCASAPAEDKSTRDGVKQYERARDGPMNG